jgi:hypothetical protein
MPQVVKPEISDLDLSQSCLETLFQIIVSLTFLIVKDIRSVQPPDLASEGLPDGLVHGAIGLLTVFCELPG